MKTALGRRELVKTLSGVLAASLWHGRSRGAVAPAGAQHLSITDPAALAVGYVEDAAKLDAKRNPKFEPGSKCENCLLLQGSAGADYRPCDLFPGKLVAVKGWCSGWTAEI